MQEAVALAAIVWLFDAGYPLVGTFAIVFLLVDIVVGFFR